MKSKMFMLFTTLAFTTASLNAEGPPRRPDDDGPPGKKSGKKGSSKSAPGPSSAPAPSAPKPGPTPASGPGFGPKGIPGVPDGPPRVRTPDVRPAVPMVRDREVPRGPGAPERSPGIVITPPGPPDGPRGGVRLDLGILRGALGIPPRKVAPGVVVRPALPPDTPPPPRPLMLRVYDQTRSVVVVPAEDGGESTELPYVAMPVLFAAGTAELLDKDASKDLQSLASALLEVQIQDSNARFVIEGHASVDEADAGKLSKQRAAHVYAELVSKYNVPAAILAIKGYGSEYAQYPKGPAAQMQLDRRVLVVRTK